MKKNLVFTLFVIFLPAALFWALGCMKPPSTAIDKGVTTACSVIDQTIASIQRPSVLGIKKSEFAYIETSIRLESQQPDVTQQYAVTVMDRVEDPYMIQLTIREETHEKVNGEFKTSIKEGPVLISKGTSATVANIASIQLPELTKAATGTTTPTSIQEMSKKLFIKTGAAGGQGASCANQASGAVISYNNLTISKIDVAVPPIVQARPNCGLANCNGPISGQLLKFDRWISDPNKAGSELKVTTYLVTAGEVPFFATIFSQCVQYSWPYAGRQILITSCDDVKDFKFGI